MNKLSYCLIICHEYCDTVFDYCESVLFLSLLVGGNIVISFQIKVSIVFESVSVW